MTSPLGRFCLSLALNHSVLTLGTDGNNRNVTCPKNSEKDDRDVNIGPRFLESGTDGNTLAAVIESGVKDGNNNNQGEEYRNLVQGTVHSESREEGSLLGNSSTLPQSVLKQDSEEEEDDKKVGPTELKLEFYSNSFMMLNKEKPRGPIIDMDAAEMAGRTEEVPSGPLISLDLKAAESTSQLLSPGHGTEKTVQRSEHTEEKESAGESIAPRQQPDMPGDSADRRGLNHIDSDDTFEEIDSPAMRTRLRGVSSDEELEEDEGKIFSEARTVQYAAFSCHLCTYRAKHQSSVKRHVEVIHAGVLFPCPSCPYLANRADNLRQHNASMHGEQEFTCLNCDYTARRRSTLRHHVAAKHSGTLFQCPRCRYEANRPDNLRNHMRAVHQEEEFRCRRCNFRATTRCQLRSHCSREHTTRSSSFECFGCSFRASRCNSLQKHLKICGHVEKREETKTEDEIDLEERSGDLDKGEETEMDEETDKEERNGDLEPEVATRG